ncbi:MAG: YSIRK-type signal peptide-containing protein, partial [Lactobacillus sp.]|uniref:pectate lyase-like adhesive domain-containing protein n=1 Tax=Lactobacillus sp. TaxID=1591 RepID=UPI0023CB4833
MVSKNNIEMKNKKMRDEKQRFSIRKFSVGAASVLIGLSFSLYTGQQVSADTVDNSDKSVVATTNDNKDSNQATQNKSEEESNADQAKSTVTDDLDHSTVVASYEANATSDGTKTESNNTATENKQDEKTATETAKTNTTAEQKADSEKNTANNVTTEKAETSTKTDTVSIVNKAAEVAKTDVVNTATEASNSEKNVATENVENSTKVETANTIQQENVNGNTNEVANNKTEATVKTDAISNTNNAVDVKTNETSDVSTNTLKLNDVVKNASFLSSKSATESKVAVAAEDTEDPNAVTVRDANGLIDAIQNGTATTINIANDINLGTKTSSQYTSTNIKNKRDITIESATPGTKYTIDFAGYGFNMYDQNYGVTFKDLNLYGQSYYGIVRSAGSYTFDNVNYTGSQLVYTDSGYSSTVTFKNTVNATSVASYVGPIDNKTRSAQGNKGNQQVLQFRNGTNSIVFDKGSNVHLKTVNSNVIEIDGGTTAIDVKTGANVTLEPHTTSGPESNFMNVNGIGRGIASSGTTTLNIEKDATLNIPLTMDSGDKYLSSALDLNSGATINNNGTLKITSDGSPYYRSDGWDDPV